MAGKKKGSKSKAEKTKQIRMILLVALVLAAVIFIIVDPQGFEQFTANVLGEMEQRPTEAPTAANSPAALPEPADTPRAQALGGVMDVYVLDVGQGDSIFLRSPNGKTMLVDASESKHYDAIDAFLQSQGVTKLDVVIATHPHSDHIGAMHKVIRNYEIGTFYLPEVTHTTATYEKMITALEERDVATEIVWGGENSFIEWDEDAELRVLSPFEGVDYDLNNWSVVVRAAYGETSIMLTGDAETPAEEEMLARLPADCLTATVLKMGHHGSSTSTSEAFWEAMAPELAVISVGEGNDYGHPHKETLEKLEKWGVPFYRTDECGILHLIFDGAKVEVKTER